MPILRLLLYILVPIVLVTVPTSYFEAGQSLCLVKFLTGVECPGCGMTRALSSLAHGDVISAIHFNSLVVIIGPLFSYTLIRALLNELSVFSGRSSSLVECHKSAEKNNS
ncbi:MAG: DUF2752 domain-containing protein [Geobacteraceae bacterium]